MSVNIKENDALNGIAKLIPASNITLSSLPDTSITLPQAEQSLGYDEASGRWINYNVRISVYYSDDFRGLNISCTKGQTTITKIAPMDGNAVVFYVNEKGTWTVSAEIGATSYTDTIIVTSFGVTYPAQLVTSSSQTPEGATVEPTDDIQIWLACANITDKSYTTLDAVLADRETFETLIADSNACDYMARSTSWAGKGSLVPTMTSNTTPSGVVSGSDASSAVAPYVYSVFDGNKTTLFGFTGSLREVWIQYQFPNAQTIRKYKIINSSVEQAKLQASNDGTTFRDLCEYGNSMTRVVENEDAYTYYRIWFKTTSSAVQLYEVEYYENGICDDESAMALIGKYDYCSNALLSNATWAEAIANSDYFEEVLNVKVPTMTSNTTPSGECISTSEYSGRYTYFAFNHENTPVTSANNYWVSNTTSVPVYIGYKFTSAVIVNKIKVLFGLESGSPINTSTTFILQGSNTGNSDDWHDIGNSITNTSTSPQIYGISNSTSYLYYRIYISEQTISGGSYKGQVNILQFYGRKPLKNSYVPLVPTMTSNTTPSGEASASSTDSGNAYKAFDGNDSTYVNVLVDTTSDTENWIQYKFPSSIIVDRVIMAKSTSGHTHNDVTIKVQASNDGTTFTDLYSTTYSYTGQPYTYDFTNTTAYMYYRVWFSGGTEKWQSGSSWYYYNYVYTLQFYAKLDTTIVHSAPLDTIYYIEDGSPVIVATTNSDGDGEFDLSSLEDKEYTFYSSVAKDPSNLSNDFSKAIRITKTQWGGTTELYLMPNGEVIYWYGYKGRFILDDSDLQSRVTYSWRSGASNAGISLSINTYNLEYKLWQPYASADAHTSQYEITGLLNLSNFSHAKSIVSLTNSNNAREIIPTGSYTSPCNINWSTTPSYTAYDSTLVDNIFDVDISSVNSGVVDYMHYTPGTRNLYCYLTLSASWLE